MNLTTALQALHIHNFWYIFFVMIIDHISGTAIAIHLQLVLGIE